MQVDRKTFAVLQSIIILNLTSFLPVNQQYFACKLIFGVCARMHDYENPHARCQQIGKHSQYFKVLSYLISHHSVHQISSTLLANAFLGSVHVCTTMKTSMHDASRSENICITSKYHDTDFHIIPLSRLAVFCFQIHFGGLCTYARL